MSLQFKETIAFSTRSSVRIGGLCEAYFPKTEEDLLLLVDHFYSENVPFKVLGRATNILATDCDIKTKVIFTDFFTAVTESENGLRMQSGVRMSRIIFAAAKMKKALLPELIGVPGSVGGMVYQNASCYGRAISDCFLKARVYDPEKRKLIVYSKNEMNFDYRSSLLKRSPLILLDAEFHFLPDTCDPMKVIHLVTQKRKMYSPEGPSLGSAFMKHEGCSVGMLLDQLSQKGRFFGGIAVSKRHAGILVNFNNGTCADYKRALYELEELIFQNYGFLPIPEIECLE